MQILNFIRKNNRLLLFLTIMLFILILLVGIYYIDSSNKKSLSITNSNSTIGSDLKGYDILRPKILALLLAPDLPRTTLARIARNLNILEDKTKSEKDRYEALVNVNLFFNSLYSDTNDPRFRPVSKDLGEFAKLNFPKFYEKAVFFTVCQDPSCAESPQPKEILKIIDDINASDLPNELKKTTAQDLKNPGFLPNNARVGKAQVYFAILTGIQNFGNYSPSGAYLKISDELDAYLENNFPKEIQEIKSNHDKVLNELNKLNIKK